MMNEGEITLLTLARIQDAQREMEGSGLEEVTSKPDDPTWEIVASSVFDGFTRGWVGEARFYFEGGKPRMTWHLSASGVRAVAAWKRRNGMGERASGFLGSDFERDPSCD